MLPACAASRARRETRQHTEGRDRARPQAASGWVGVGSQKWGALPGSLVSGATRRSLHAFPQEGSPLPSRWAHQHSARSRLRPAKRLWLWERVGHEEYTLQGRRRARSLQLRGSGSRVNQQSRPLLDLQQVATQYLKILKMWPLLKSSVDGLKS